MIAIRLGDDIAAARNAVRETGLVLGFPVPALRLAQAVISEMCLYALNSGITADLSVYALKRAGRDGISMVMQAPVEITEKELNDDRLTPGLGSPGPNGFLTIGKSASGAGEQRSTRSSGSPIPHMRDLRANTFRWLKRRRTKPGSSDVRLFSMVSASQRWPFFTRKQ